MIKIGKTVTRVQKCQSGVNSFMVSRYIWVCASDPEQQQLRIPTLPSAQIARDCSGRLTVRDCLFIRLDLQ